VIEEKSNIDVILFSHGGDPDQAYIIGTLLQECATKKLTIIIPRYAKSAATLLTCAADEIVMLPASELGPVELMIETPETKRYVPVRTFVESIEMIAKMDLGEMKLDVLKETLNRIPITELRDFERLSEYTKSLAEKLLTRRMFKGDSEKAKEIAKKLCEGYKSHSAPITLFDAKEIGLKLIDVPKDVENLLWKLHKLWISTVIEYENSFPLEEAETLNFRVGRGVIFCTKRKEKEA
jgi:ClpP class serine protease